MHPFAIKIRVHRLKHDVTGDVSQFEVQNQGRRLARLWRISFRNHGHDLAIHFERRDFQVADAKFFSKSRDALGQNGAGRRFDVHAPRAVKHLMVDLQMGAVFLIVGVEGRQRVELIRRRRRRLLHPIPEHKNRNCR